MSDSSATANIMKQEFALNLNDTARTAQVCKALSSETRLEILKTLTQKALSISEVAQAFYLPMSSACLHTKILEEAGLITLLPKPGLRGTQKLCGMKASTVLVDLFAHQRNAPSLPPAILSMPVGNFTDCDVAPPCGIASEVSYLAYEDTPFGFYSAQRNTASLLWLTQGYLEYKFSNKSLQETPAADVEFSFEICSEAPGYNNNWPSDITLWVNGTQICTFMTRGDYGDRRGMLNPEWWSDSLTQYGELKRFAIGRDGCYLDGHKVSGETIDSLRLTDGYCLRLRLGVAADAVHVGGLNLFGRKFGDYPQDIVMKVRYQ